MLSTGMPSVPAINDSNLHVCRDPFRWDDPLLRLYIRTIKHDYNETDPRMRPVLINVTQTEVNYDYRQMKSPPCFLALDQPLIENIVRHRPLIDKVRCRYNLTGRQTKAKFTD